MIEESPTTTGSSAAIRLPNTQISAMTVSGIAMASALARSSLVWSLTCVEGVAEAAGRAR